MLMLKPVFLWGYQALEFRIDVSGKTLIYKAAQESVILELPFPI